jgi:ketosteroid isomerase-like protein
MKRMSVILLATILAAPLPTARADKADDVKKVDRALTDAHIKRDAKEVERMTADGYVHITPHGKVLTKKQIVTGLTEDHRLNFEKIDDSEVNVALYGDTAVMTGLSRIKGKSKSRGEFDEEYRWTRVYVMHDGKWQCVSEQLGRHIPDEKKGK